MHNKQKKFDLSLDATKTIKMHPCPQMIQFNRKLAGYTQKQMAELLGVSVMQAYYYEKGHTKLSVEKLMKLVDAWDVSIQDFYEVSVADLRKYATMTIKNYLNNPEADEYKRSRISVDVLRLQDTINELIEEQETTEEENLRKMVEDAENNQDNSDNSDSSDVDYGSIEEGEVGATDTDDMPPELNDDEDTTKAVHNA